MAHRNALDMVSRLRGPQYLQAAAGLAGLYCILKAIQFIRWATVEFTRGLIGSINMLPLVCFSTQRAYFMLRGKQLKHMFRQFIFCKAEAVSCLNPLKVPM